MITLSTPKSLFFEPKYPNGIEVSEVDIITTETHGEVKTIRVLIAKSGTVSPLQWIILESISGENYTGSRSEEDVESALITQISQQIFS